MLQFDRDVWPPTSESISFNVFGEQLIHRAQEAVRLEGEGMRDHQTSSDKIEVSELGSYVGSTLIATLGIEESLPLHESLAERIEPDELKELFWVGFRIFANYNSGEATKVQFNPELGKCELVVPQA